jgi:acetyl esterase/lipase
MHAAGRAGAVRQRCGLVERALFGPAEIATWCLFTRDLAIRSRRQTPQLLRRSATEARQDVAWLGMRGRHVRCCGACPMPDHSRCAYWGFGLCSIATALTASCADLDSVSGTDDVTEALAGPVHGLSAEYFQGDTPDPHQRVLARIDSNVDMRWGFGAPDPALPVDHFAVRWSGTIEPRYSEIYTLSLPHIDDTARVLIDGAVVIDHPNAWSPSSGAVALVRGRRHDIVVEYGEAWGWAEIQLAWSSASQPLEVVPATQLAPAPTPPLQPASGPGGAAYPSAGCTVTQRAVWWNDDLTYWVFEPASPAPARAPVVVFDHGWMGNAPVHYAHWLDHLCRRGNIVIFPKYQSLLTLPVFFTPNAVWSVRDALAFLATPGHVQPQLELGMVVVGHSAGGTVAANMADTWQANGLPFPRALFAVEPALDGVVPFTALDQIPTTTSVACLAGNDDTVVGRGGCDTIFQRATQVHGKRYVWFYSDDHGAPALVADHFAPSELTPYTDAFDFFLIWKITDAMRDCAFLGTSCAVDPAVLGTWSDGVPMTPATVTIDAAPPCPADSTAIGCS